MSWETRFSVRKHDDDFVLVRSDPSLYRNQHTSRQGGGTLLGRYRAGSRINVAFGGEFFLDALNSSNLGDRSERRGALFGEALVGTPGTAVVSLGARTDWHQEFGAFFSPSVSGSLNLVPGVRARTSLGRSFRAPTWTERYYQDPVNIGQPDLHPEQAWSVEVGADVFRSSGFRFSTTLFFRSATSLIDWARPLSAADTDPWETRNVEEANFKGIETDLQFEGPFDLKWTFGGTVLSMHSEEAAGFRSKYALRPLKEQFTFGVERTIGASVSGRLRVRHGRREGEDSYRRLDLRMRFRTGAGWLLVDVLNITNFNYTDVTGARAPGRALFVGFELVGK